MSETSHLLAGKKAMTPLWIVALFVSLTEVVLGAAVTQTTGGIQVALTVFVIVFPTLVAGFFFLTLWHRPFVFYPPTEFGQQVKVSEYVEAMQRRPGLLMQASGPIESAPATEKEKRAASDIADTFLIRLGVGAGLVIYICSIAFSKQVTFNISELCSKLEVVTVDYFTGILMATRAARLLNYTYNEDLFYITELNSKIMLDTHAKFEKHLDEGSKKATKPVNESMKKRIMDEAILIEQFFSGSQQVPQSDKAS